MGLLTKLLSGKGKTAYYPGCLTKFALPEVQQDYEKILKRIGVKFIEVPEFYCCGSPVLNAGYKQDFEELRQKQVQAMKEYNVETVLFSCPSCYNMFKTYYPEFQPKLILQEVLNKLEEHEKEFEPKGKITFHDPCHLGRYSGEYDLPRQLLSKLGYEIVEMRDSKENSMCCGAGGGLRSNYPEKSKKVGRMRIGQALETKAETLTTSCPMCYLHLKESAEGTGLKVVETSQVILNALD